MYEASGKLSFSGLGKCVQGYFFNGSGILINGITGEATCAEHDFLDKKSFDYIAKDSPPKKSNRPKFFAYDASSTSKGRFDRRNGAYIPDVTASRLKVIKRSAIRPGMDLSGFIVVD